ncbi:MAG: hypothetical protein AAGH89_00600 [Verrucomicrobiota bacterium]
MSEAVATLTEADILNDVLSPGKGDLDEKAARAILDFRFSDAAQNRIRGLLDAQNRDELSPNEQGDLEKFLRVGQLIDLLQAKARLSLKK